MTPTSVWQRTDNPGGAATPPGITRARSTDHAGEARPLMAMSPTGMPSAIPSSGAIGAISPAAGAAAASHQRRPDLADAPLRASGQDHGADGCQFSAGAATLPQRLGCALLAPLTGHGACHGSLDERRAANRMTRRRLPATTRRGRTRLLSFRRCQKEGEDIVQLLRRQRATIGRHVPSATEDDHGQLLTSASRAAATATGNQAAATRRHTGTGCRLRGVLRDGGSMTRPGYAGFRAVSRSMMPSLERLCRSI